MNKEFWCERFVIVHVPTDTFVNFTKDAKWGALRRELTLDMSLWESRQRAENVLEHRAHENAITTRTPEGTLQNRPLNEFRVDQVRIQMEVLP